MKIEWSVNAIKTNLAGWLTGLALLIFASMVIVFSAMVFSGADSASAVAAQADQPDSERTFLLRQKIWLMARINLCEQEKQGSIPAHRSVCPAAEQAKVPEYRKRILEVDRRLQGL